MLVARVIPVIKVIRLKTLTENKIQPTEKCTVDLITRKVEGRKFYFYILFFFILYYLLTTIASFFSRISFILGRMSSSGVFNFSKYIQQQKNVNEPLMLC